MQFYAASDYVLWEEDLSTEMYFIVEGMLEVRINISASASNTEPEGGPLEQAHAVWRCNSAVVRRCPGTLYHSVVARPAVGMCMTLNVWCSDLRTLRIQELLCDKLRRLVMLAAPPYSRLCFIWGNTQSCGLGRPAPSHTYHMCCEQHSVDSVGAMNGTCVLFMSIHARSVVRWPCKHTLYDSLGEALGYTKVVVASKAHGCQFTAVFHRVRTIQSRHVADDSITPGMLPPLQMCCRTSLEGEHLYLD